MFPSCRITSSGAGVSQDRSSAAEGGRSKFRLDLPSSIFFQEVCGQANHFSLSLSLFLSSSLLGLMRRSWHLTDRLPLWQLVWNIYGKLWIMGMEISGEKYMRIFWLAMKTLAICRESLWKLYFFLDGV